MAAAAACSRGNLQLLLATREELLQLAEVQGLLDAAAAAGQQPPPSVLRGLVIRLKYAGAYHLLPVEQLLVAADGKRGLAVQAPGPASAEQLRVLLSSTSGSSPLTGDQWEATGQAEAARFAEHLWQRGHSLALAETAAVAWRKQAALAWYAQHGAQPPAEQELHLPALLQQLADAAGIAGMQQELEPEQRQEQGHDVVIGTPLAQPRQPPAVAAIAVPVPPRQAAEAAAAIPAVQAPAQHTVAPADTPAFTGPNGASTEGLAAITAVPASLAAQVEPLQAAAASLVPGAPAAPAAASGSSAATAAALAGIQRQLRELQQLAQQGQPQQAHAPPHNSWPQPEQKPGSPACSQLPGNGFDSYPPPAYGGSWGRPPADLHRFAGFQPAGSRWPEPPTPADRPWADDGSSSCSASLVRLPGNPSLSSARTILAATLRRAVPCYERDFEDKRAALNGLLRLGLACSRSGERGAFEQALVALDDLAHELQQEGAEGAELYRGVDGMQQLRHLLRDVKEAFLVQLTWQHRRQHVLLRVDRLSAVFGRPEDLEAGIARGGASGGRDASAQQRMSAETRSPDGRGPPAAAHDAVQLRHLAPARLLGGAWGLTTAQVMLSCMPHLPEDQMLAELEAMCRDMGTTVITSRVVSNKDRRGDLVFLTFPSAQQAAVAVERLQLAKFHGIALHAQPLDREVAFWQQVYPQEGGAAADIISALKSGALPDWPPGRTGAEQDQEARGRRRQRSGSGDRSHSQDSRGSDSGLVGALGGGGGTVTGGGGLPPAEMLLAPAFVRGTWRSGWSLTCSDIFITGLQPGPMLEQIRFLDELCARVGATVVVARCEEGDARGDMGYLTLASAAQAARVIEQLSDTQVLGRKLYIRPLERNVEALRRRYPQLAAEADRALAAATSARSQRSNFVADAHTVPPGRQPPHALLRVDRLSAAFGRPEDLEDLEAGGGAGSNRKRKAAEGQPRAPPPGSPARPGPSAVVWDPALLRHLAPVQLSGSGWRLTGAEIALGCTPMPRGSAAEDQLFAELEALCCGVGSTVVSSRLVPEKEQVYLTFPSPEQAAVAIEHLQTAQFPGRQVKVEPVHKSVGMWRSAFASEAAAADRAIAALKSGTLSSWPRSVGCAPDVPKTQRHVRRSRSRSRSRCCGGGCAQGLRLGLPSPGVLLAPAFVRRTNHAAWELTSPDIFISGLPPSSEDDQIRLLDELSEQAGATLVAARCRRGDLRGDMAYITLASASQAARMIEQFSDTQVLGRRVYLRPLEKDVEALRRRYPELATDAAEALAAAKSIRQQRPDVAADANAVPLGRQPPPQQQQQGEKRRRRSLSPSSRKRSRSRSRSGGRGGSPGGPRRRRTAHPASNVSAQRASEYGTPSRSARPGSAAKADQPSSGGVRGGSRTPPRSCSPTRSTAALHS